MPYWRRVEVLWKLPSEESPRGLPVLCYAIFLGTFEHLRHVTQGCFLIFSGLQASLLGLFGPKASEK